MDHKNEAGFTLIELMIVIAIVAILVAIAVPSYQAYITRSNRAVGQAELMKLAARQEQYFLNNKSYASTLAQLGYSNSQVDREGVNVASGGIYSLSLSNDEGAAPYYTFSFTAAPTGSHSDSDCGTLSMDEQGTKGATGSSSLCWD